MLVQLGGMPWHQTTATHYHAQLVLPDNRAIKGLVVYYLVWLGSMIFDLVQGACVGLVPCCGQDGYQAQILQQHTINRCNYNTIQHILGPKRSLY